MVKKNLIHSTHSTQSVFHCWKDFVTPSLNRSTSAARAKPWCLIRQSFRSSVVLQSDQTTSPLHLISFIVSNMSLILVVWSYLLSIQLSFLSLKLRPRTFLSFFLYLTCNLDIMLFFLIVSTFQYVVNGSMQFLFRHISGPPLQTSMYFLNVDQPALILLRNSFS